MKPKRPTDNDIGFNEHGQPYLIGEAAGARQDAIVDHPDAKPVLIVAMHNDEIGVRAFGPPSAEVADLLDHIAATYRLAVTASQGPKQ